MNAEQKKIALECIRLWGSEDLSDCAGDQMAALLQELVDAPEPEPVAKVTGYYGGYLSIATIDGRVLPAGTALYLAPPAPPAPSVPDGWIRAIDEAMVVHHIGIADRADSYEVAKKKLNELLAINSDIARDCSEAPADLARDAERYRWLRTHGLQRAWVSLGTDFEGDNFASFRCEFNLPEPPNLPYEDDEGLPLADKDFDAAIDAAIEREILGGNE